MFRLFRAIFRLNTLHIYIYIYIQSVPGGNVNILAGHTIGHSKQKVYMYGKVKGEVHHCTGTEALYRPYGPYGE